MCYWACYVLNGLNFLLKDSKGTNIEISRRDAIDCLISLQRALKDMRSVWYLFCVFTFCNTYTYIC